MRLNWDRIEAAAQWVVIAGLVAAGVAYAGDYLYVRMRMAGETASVIGSVTVQRYWEIPQKNGKVEYSFDPPTDQPCIHSIFSHAGYSPCWYLSRRKVMRMSLERGRDHESVHAAARIADLSAAAESTPKVYPEPSVRREAMKAPVSAGAA